MFDPITVLREVGFPVDQLSEGQRAVLAALSEEETAVIAQLHIGLRATESDVVAHDLKML